MTTKPIKATIWEQRYLHRIRLSNVPLNSWSWDTAARRRLLPEDTWFLLYNKLRLPSQPSGSQKTQDKENTAMLRACSRSMIRWRKRDQDDLCSWFWSTTLPNWKAWTNGCQVLATYQLNQPFPYEQECLRDGEDLCFSDTKFTRKRKRYTGLLTFCKHASRRETAHSLKSRSFFYLSIPNYWCYAKNSRNNNFKE